MKTLLLGLSCWTLFLGAMLAACLIPLHATGPVAPFIRLGVVFLVLSYFGSLIPCTFEEVGTACALYLRRYKLATFFLRISHFLFLLPIWMNAPFKSFGALQLSRVALVQNRLDTAAQWCKVARRLARNETWSMRFRIEVLCGEIHLLQEQSNPAREHLLEAVRLYSVHHQNELIWGSPIAEELSEGQVRCLDMLGQVALRENDPVLAQQYFEQSFSVRKATASLVTFASAYESNYQARLAMHRGCLDAAEEHAIAAARRLPQNALLVQDREITIAVLRTLWSIDTPRAHEAFSIASEGQLDHLHPLELELLTTKNCAMDFSIGSHDYRVVPMIPFQTNSRCASGTRLKTAKAHKVGDVIDCSPLREEA